MKVKELIKQLQKCDPDANAFVQDEFQHVLDIYWVSKADAQDCEHLDLGLNAVYIWAKENNE